MLRRITATGGGARAVRARSLALVLVGLLACLLLGVGASSALAFEDYSGGAFQILAPGEEGGLPAGPFSTDQGVLYDKLTPLRGRIKTSDLEKYYLSEKFGVQGAVMSEENEAETGEPGLQILRDSHDIPHIYGSTRGAVMYGSGWVAAKDRGLLLDLGLGPAYVAADGVPGLNPFGLLLHERSFTPSVHSVDFLASRRKCCTEAGPEGERVLKDLEAWCEGVNAYELTLPAPYRLPHITSPPRSPASRSSARSSATAEATK